MKGKRALTLVELLLVLTMLAIMAVVGMVAYGSYHFQNLMAAAERISADLKYVQNLALTTNEWHGADFQSEPINAYHLYLTTGGTDTIIGDPANPNRPFQVSLADNFPGINLSGVNIGGGAKVEFNPLGIPYGDKTGAPLAADGVITLSGAGTTVTVRIIPETGRIIIQ